MLTLEMRSAPKYGANVGVIEGDIAIPAQRSGKAVEIMSGEISESGFLKMTQKYLGEGYKEVSSGRFLSKDQMRQVRFGNHETKSANNLHGHFEAYDKPADQGGRAIENAVVKITP